MLDVWDAVRAWHEYKMGVVSRQANQTYVVRQDKVDEFVGRIDAASRQIRAQAPDIGPELWESLVEVITNAKKFN